MARYEADREDLLREATALVERIELAVTDDPNADHVVVGFRRNGAASVYFGGEPAYHFNSAGELRRAFDRGALIKAEQGRLVEMRRNRKADVVALENKMLADAEQQRLVDEIQADLRRLATELREGRYSVIGQVPAEVDVRGRVTAWLEGLGTVEIASSPHAR
jgi:hypothetical protein